ncbi:Major facilitator superfamily [Kalmanozyma brasiliensis GHG001]|uniref:Major facilitator superfamily (MFS) profile domain-containing protein n=1 Tax=Kalmanozyma brasiliensis (strain GHG001) TaxID=1365824 RepID=V5EUP0_KALBG|nr:Major facilitator superfamily [Kalmanozyma brasiliensis GHG001]EST09080.1 Major facilitator superfamily [Kalmanozyma brasiliensis GHG001]
MSTSQPSNGHAFTRSAGDDPEQEPLLPTSSPRKDTPLPKRAIIILILMRLAEPISFTLIFPFVNDLVYTLPPYPARASVGYYAGIIESLFSVSQTCTILFWGSLSDRIGRKPVLISGLCGVACSAVLFGLSRSFVWAVLARSLAGATNGNVAIIKSVMGELTDGSNQARAFSFLALTWTVGSFIGPLLGGYLSRPAEQYPGVFGEGSWAGFGGLWVEYPFLLPCLVSAGLTLGSITLGAVALDETLPSKVEQKRIEQQQKKRRSQQADDDDASHSNGYGAVENTTTTETTSTTTNHAQTEPPTPPTIFSILSIAQIQKVLLSYGLLALISVALDAVLVLYLFEPAALGGVGFTSSETGILLSINGLGGALVQLILFPPLQKRYGTLRVYQASMLSFPLSMVLLPVANAFARSTSATSVAVWTCLLISTAIRVMGGMAYASNTILVTQCASLLDPSPALGTLNSLAQMSSSIARAAGPYLANSLFAFSVTTGLLGGQMVWVVLGVIGFVGPLVCLRLDDMERGQRTERSEGR